MKRILVLALAILMCVSLVACAFPGAEKTNEEIIPGGNAEEKETEKQEDPKQEEPKKEDKAKAYSVGEAITLSFVNLTLESFEKAPDGYEFAHKDGYVTYKSSIDAPDGMDLFCFKGKMTNLASNVLYPSNKPVYGVMKINNFEYVMKLSFYNANVDKSMHELVGGMEARVFFYAEVPEAVAAQAANAEVSFGFVENMDPSKYVQGVEDLDYLYKTTVSVAGL